MNQGADILDLLFEHGSARPAQPAIQGEKCLGYGAFCSQVRRLARALSAQHEAPRVLIHLPQGADAYAAMFATIAAGGVYSATNSQAPQTKHGRHLQAFDPDVVVSTADRYFVLCAGVSRIPLVEPAQVGGAELSSPRTAHHLAYVKFTSGSTGEPKGVMISRSALQHYVEWILDAFELRPTDRLSQHPNIAFDLSILDIYGALCSGAALVPIDGAADRLMPANAIRKYGITIWNSVPSVINLMIEAGQVTHDHLATLRLINFCGEPLLPDQLAAIFEARPDLVVQNTYGPTEATVSMTSLRLNADNFRDACLKTVALGDPIRNMGLILDGGGDKGEMVITGPQLADGYWRNPEETRRAFRTIIVNGQPRRAYFTGDLGERVNGHLYFRERLDTQTKIRGHRLELDEVNWALRKCSAGNAVSAVVVDGHLHAFIETSETAIDAADLRARLIRWLEPHAIPTQFHAIARLPRNQNDKIDTRALRDLVREVHGALR
jgi:D-alanine--poly(phosphoribitol) ligase subunit 1